MSEPILHSTDFGNQLIDDFGTIPASTPAQVERARRQVAARALDAEDARELLSMLGLGAA